ncbi:MAG: molybdopterin-guanine dinucleotide biosynthesis protein B [Cellulosilyticaceae bacterium]
MIGVTLEEALAMMVATTSVKREVIQVPILQSLGYILAEDQCAPLDQPPFHRAPVDGYACKSEDLVGATSDQPVQLQVVAEVMAGAYYEGSIQKGEAIRIMTGAAIPEGCDCCVRQESTDYGEDTVAIYEPVKAYGNYCFQGEDFQKGSILLTKGMKIGAIEVGILASMGYSHVKVYRKPKVALLTTGDEVVAPGEPLGLGKIYNSNQALLVARMYELGIDVSHIITPPDEGEAVAQAIRQVIEEVDVVLTTGGVSVGKKDILHEALPLLGAERIFWKVQLQPGTPVIYSIYKQKPILSLSGNPFGALTTFELLMRPLIGFMGQDESFLPRRTGGVMADAFNKASKKRRFIRARYHEGKVYMPSGLHSSGVLSSMLGCNCLIEIKPGTEGLQVGDAVTVILLEKGTAVKPVKKPLLIAISGVKNSGKTTLITKLIPEFRKKGFKVGTIKHDGHDFEADIPGTDTYKHVQAGACETALFSKTQAMVVQKVPGLTEVELLESFKEADIVLLEGFKGSKYPKIEIVRKGNSTASICDPSTLLAVASDGDVKVEGVPVVDLNKIEEIMSYMMTSINTLTREE